VQDHPPRKRSGKLALVALLLALNSALGLAAETLKNGSKAPLPKVSFGADGTRLSAATYARSLKKKNLLLIFYRTGTCSVCVQQLVEVARAKDEIFRSNTAILAMSLDDAIQQARTKEKIGGAYPLLIDPDGRTTKAFGVFNPAEQLAYPAVFLIGPNMRVLNHHVAKSLNDRPSLSTLLTWVKRHKGR